MAGEWRTLNWGDVATLEYGRALRGHGEGRGPFRVFGTNGPIGWHDEALCLHPDPRTFRLGLHSASRRPKPLGEGARPLGDAPLTPSQEVPPRAA